MMHLQLFGLDCPPFYFEEDVVTKIKKISEVDAKINELLIVREEYVKDLDKAIKKSDSHKA